MAASCVGGRAFDSVVSRTRCYKMVAVPSAREATVSGGAGNRLRRGWQDDQELWDAFRLPRSGGLGATEKARCDEAGVLVWELLTRGARRTEWRDAADAARLSPDDLVAKAWENLRNRASQYDAEQHRSLEAYLTEYSSDWRAKPKSALGHAFKELSRNRLPGVDSPDSSDYDSPSPDSLSAVADPRPNASNIADSNAFHQALHAGFVTRAELLGLLAEYDYTEHGVDPKDLVLEAEEGNETFEARRRFAYFVYPSEEFTDAIFYRVKDRRPAVEARLALHRELVRRQSIGVRTSEQLTEALRGAKDANWLDKRQLRLLLGDEHGPGFLTATAHGRASLILNGDSLFGPGEATQIAVRNLLAALLLSDDVMESSFSTVRQYAMSSARLGDTAGLASMPILRREKPAHCMLDRMLICALSGKTGITDAEQLAELTGVSDPIARCEELAALSSEKRRPWADKPWAVPGVHVDAGRLKIDKGAAILEQSIGDTLEVLGIKPEGRNHAVYTESVEALYRFRETVSSTADAVGVLHVARNYTMIHSWLAGIGDHAELRAALERFTPVEEDEVEGSYSRDPNDCEAWQLVDALIADTERARKNRESLIELGRDDRSMPPVRLYQHCTYCGQRVGREVSLRDKCGPLLVGLLRQCAGEASRPTEGGDERGSTW